MYRYVYVYMYICVYVYICMCVCIMYIYMYVCVYIYPFLTAELTFKLCVYSCQISFCVFVPRHLLDITIVNVVVFVLWLYSILCVSISKCVCVTVSCEIREIAILLVLFVILFNLFLFFN